MYTIHELLSNTPLLVCDILLEHQHPFPFFKKTFHLLKIKPIIDVLTRNIHSQNNSFIFNFNLASFITSFLTIVDINFTREKL